MHFTERDRLNKKKTENRLTTMAARIAEISCPCWRRRRRLVRVRRPAGWLLRPPPSQSLRKNTIATSYLATEKVSRHCPVAVLAVKLGLLCTQALIRPSGLLTNRGVDRSKNAGWTQADRTSRPK